MKARPFRIRDWSLRDLVAISRINETEIPHVSSITVAELKVLAEQSFYFRLLESESGDIAGFVLALDETATYSSLNFQWFKSRYPRFIYIDRVVVSASYQGLGIGRLLYEDLEEVAKRSSSPLACEVNTRPPNPGSLRFHQRFGFREVGVQNTEGGKKTVALLLRER
ncbi:MAG: GNAT family N-acetyltransferase [Deltaproteobacteria bacterium]|nr:GNAT family N-acetyltransferase [Deltaproteobacteria bacterium]